jgi:integrase
MRDMQVSSFHIVPISNQSIIVFKEMRNLNPYRDHVFPSICRPRKSMNDCVILVAPKRMGFVIQITDHRFRFLELGELKEKLGYSHEIADRQ